MPVDLSCDSRHFGKLVRFAVMYSIARMGDTVQHEILALDTETQNSPVAQKDPVY